MSTVTDEIYVAGSDPSEVQEFFKGKTIFLTGSTGFLGKLLIEKLLRTCNNLNRIYLLVREKKGKEPAERFKEIFDIPAFENLKKQFPNFEEKLSLCIGDCLKPDLGLSQKDQELLKDEVDCVLHCAATVRFDASLRKAAYINVRATKDLLRIAKDMKRLKSFIHVSTAFAYCPKKDIDEVIYEPTITGQKLLELVEALDDDMLDAITPTIINEWPNTYAFTKAVAEDVVRSDGKGLPISIFRPSIVIASAKEPIPGWLDNIYGPTGVLLAAALGLMRTLYCDSKKRADLVPADYVVSAILVAAWNVGQENVNQQQDLTVYNYVSGCQNPIDWGMYKSLSKKHGIKIPSPLCMWYYLLFLNSNWYVHFLCEFFLHWIPAYIVDGILFCLGRKPLLVEGYKKIQKFSNVISYFSTQEWNFKDANVQDLWNRISPRDKELFEFDIKRLNWDQYFYSYMVGGRLYLLKDPLSTLPQGKRKYFWLKIVHYAVMTAVVLLLLVFVRFLFNIASSIKVY